MSEESYRYKCKRCGKGFKLSMRFTDHISRKTPCGTLDSIYIYNLKSEKLIQLKDSLMSDDDKNKIILKLFEQINAIYDNMIDEDRAKIKEIHNNIVTPFFFENYKHSD